MTGFPLYRPSIEGPKAYHVPQAEICAREDFVWIQRADVDQYRQSADYREAWHHERRPIWGDYSLDY